MRADLWLLLDIFLRRYPGYRAEDVLDGDPEVIERLMTIATICAEEEARQAHA